MNEYLMQYRSVRSGRGAFAAECALAGRRTWRQHRAQAHSDVGCDMGRNLPKGGIMERVSSLGGSWTGLLCFMTLGAILKGAIFLVLR